MKEVYHTDGRRLVFRFECAHDLSRQSSNPRVNSGPYANDLAAAILGDDAMNMVEDNHPSPGLDAGLSDWWGCGKSDWFFGFRDMDQLTNWFMFPDKMTAVAESARIGVYAVEAGNVKDGQFQSCFFEPECELITTLPTTATKYVPAPLYTREDGCTGGVTGWSHGPAYPFSVYGKGRYGVSFAWHVQGPNYDSQDTHPNGWKSGNDAELHAVKMRTEMTQPPKPEEAFYVLSLGASKTLAQLELESVVGKGNAKPVVGCYKGGLERSFIIKADVYLRHRLTITKLLLVARQASVLYVDRKKLAFLCYQARGLYTRRVYNGVWREVSQEEARSYDSWTRDGKLCYVTQGG
jgi:hypothetical protein